MIGAGHVLDGETHRTATVHIDEIGVWVINEVYGVVVLELVAIEGDVHLQAYVGHRGVGVEYELQRRRVACSQHHLVACYAQCIHFALALSNTIGIELVDFGSTQRGHLCQTEALSHFFTAIVATTHDCHACDGCHYHCQ